MLLSAQSYRPEITNAIRRIKAFGRWDSLQNICSNTISPGPHPVYANAGHPCLKTKNVTGLIVSTDEFGWVEPQSASQLKKHFVANENVLLNLTGAGSIGRAAIYFGADQPLTNQHIARLDINHPNDPAYVCCYLSSWWGERAIEQGISGSTGQLNLVNDHVRSLPVLLLELVVQLYIGDKVRQAERLRARARDAKQDAWTKYLNAIRSFGYNEADSKRFFRSKPRERLDPAYYTPTFSSVLDAEWLASRSQPLSNFIAEGSYGVLPDSATYGTGSERLLRATDLLACNFDPDAGIQVPSDQVQSKAQVKENDILLEVKGAIAGCVVASKLSIGKFVNGSVYRFSAKNIPVGYLVLHLTGPIKQKYCAREAVNNIIQYLNLDCIRRLPVLRLETVAEEQISEAYLASHEAQQHSFALITAAKLLVEALIEGKLSEAELKEAQEALVRGEREADRAILARLTRKGIDVAGEPPLFPDLDALYAALDQTEAGTENQYEEVSK